MKKIKIFEHGSEMVLEEYVNRFIEEHPDVIDIQFQTETAGIVSSYRVMIVYEDGE